MGQLGDMFPGAKLNDDGNGGDSDGQVFHPGPLDLDGGVVFLPRARPAKPPAEPVDEPAESD
jgi:hypothetical protein